MMFLKLLSAILSLAVVVQPACGEATSFFLSTYQANALYLKRSVYGGAKVQCKTGSGDALKFYLISPGLTTKEGDISFKSADIDRNYLVDNNGDVQLAKLQNTRFFSEIGSFIVRKNYFFDGTVSYESVGYPRNFLLCDGENLRVAEPTTRDETTRASFLTNAASSPDDSWRTCSRSCGGGTQASKERTCFAFGLFCEEPQTRSCNTQKCPSANPCDNRPCLNGGTCYRSGGRYSCGCRSGYTGENCETATNPCDNRPCLNGGTCYVSGRRYFCDCRSGHTGENCETAANPCDNRPCLNGGTCYKSGGSYSCGCSSGYTGENCETATNPCDNRPCLNGGTCYSSGRRYSCGCGSGYTGENCETALDTCSSEPCLNGGECYSSEDDYICKCLHGYTGPNCQTDTASNSCSSFPCLNGGTCQRTEGGGFICHCTAGHTGKTCDTLIAKKCDPNPCHNGKSCTETSSGYKCKCTIGYTGDTCQTKLNIGQWSPCSKPCGGGTRYRGKTCPANDVTKCPREYEDCNMHECDLADCPSPSLAHRFGSPAQCCTKSSGTCGAPITSGSAARVIGGIRSSNGQWPWMAAIYYKPSRAFYCGGSLVNNNWVVTAGHCVEPYKPADLKLLFGTIWRKYPTAGHQWVDVAEKILHKDYDNPINDIGLIKLKKPIKYTNTIKPICFPNGEDLDEDTICFAAGWGVAFQKDIPKRKASDVLMHVALRTLPLDACIQGYKNTGYERGVTPKAICSGVLAGGKDTCIGDSGGPLVCQRKNSCEWYLAGVTSFGPTQCGAGKIPGGFMGIVNYESWIKQQIS